jgi:PHD/YefM family antitoxin component YafN of YafNO toxin-antitoxin module
MKKVALQDVQAELPKYLRLAEDEDILIIEDGRPAGVLIGFKSEEDWEDYQLENDPQFLQMIAESRKDIREGRFTRLEDIDFEG